MKKTMNYTSYVTVNINGEARQLRIKGIKSACGETKRLDGRFRSAHTQIFLDLKTMEMWGETNPACSWVEYPGEGSVYMVEELREPTTMLHLKNETQLMFGEPEIQQQLEGYINHGDDWEWGMKDNYRRGCRRWW